MTFGLVHADLAACLLLIAQRSAAYEKYSEFRVQTSVMYGPTVGCSLISGRRNGVSIQSLPCYHAT